MSEEAPNRRVREGVSRSYATENKTLDALGEEAEARARERRRKREEARALRLQQKLNEAAKEQRSKEDNEYKHALEEAKKKAKERREKAQTGQQQKAADKDVTETLEEVDDICQTVMGGPDKDNQSVQVLHERVRLLASHLRDTLLHVNRLQNHKITVQYDREKLRDRINDLEEELAEAKVGIRQHKDAVAAEKATNSKQAQELAELRAECEAAKEEAAGGAANGRANGGVAGATVGVNAEKEVRKGVEGNGHGLDTAKMDAEVAELRAEVDGLKTENEELKEKLAAASSKQQQTATSAEGKSDDTEDLDASLDLTASDPAAAANRIRHLERQNKRLKDELKELETLEEDQRSENKKLKRQMRNLEADKESLEELIKAKDEQLRKLRDRRRQHLGALATANADEV